MFTRGYSMKGSKVVTGYSYEPVIEIETRREADIARLNHRIDCAEKMTSLLSQWLWNSFITLGILAVILLGIAGCYLTGLYLGTLA